MPVALTGGASWRAVIALANVNLLGPTLHAEILRRGWEGVLPIDVLQYLGLLHNLNRTRNRALRNQVLELIRAFNARGIVPMLLKGSVILFDSPYPRRTWSTRMMRDIDLMVPASDLRRATATLVDLGYTTLQQYPDGHHAFGEFVRANDPGSVDLHTELVDTNYILPAKSVWAAAVPLPISGATAVMLPPSERMLHHLLHAQLHYLSDFYRGELRLDQLYEFSVMGTKLGQYIEWERIAHQMAFHRLETALHSYLLSAMELFGVPWPLAAAAGRAARFHGRRCRWQLLLPALRLITAPWGNLRAAFAWHRMKARYGMKGSVIVWRARHAYQFIRRTTMRGALGRVFRYEQ